MIFETIKVRKEEAVLFVEILAPPMNLLATRRWMDLAQLVSDLDEHQRDQLA